MKAFLKTDKGLYFMGMSVSGLWLCLFVLALSFVGTLPVLASGTVTAGFDPTATTSSAIGTVATFLGVLVPVVLGIAVIFWMVRKGIMMFRRGSSAIAAGAGLGLVLGSTHASAQPVFATFAAGYDPTTNFTDAIGLVATYMGTIVPLVLGIAVIFWMVRKGIAMFKGGSS